MNNQNQGLWSGTSLAIVLLFYGGLLTGLTSCSRAQSAPEGAAVAVASPLEEYISAAEAAFQVDFWRTIPGEGYTAHILRMTSQRWLTEAEVDEPAWWHWLTVVVPDEVKHDTALLYIGGGTKDTPAEATVDPVVVQSALATGTIAAGLHNVPNQPLTFKGDDFGPRYEDEIIAYGWRKFMEGGARDEDAPWLARLPMTKAAVRAMDAVTVFCRDSVGRRLDGFVVAGGSKRGWTTWTTAVADRRVIAIAPFVIDLLNVEPSFRHHWQAYGFWSPAVEDYEREGIMEWQGSLEYRRLLEITEPYSYRQELALPKFLINAAGDEFFLPDSWRFYWNDLPGEKHLRYVPNTGHSLAETDALASFITFYSAIVAGTPRPHFRWRVEEGALLVETDPAFPPESISLWRANNPEGRDFRLPVVGKAYEAEPVPLSPDGAYRLNIGAPEAGFSAFFAELTFPGPGKTPFKFTTGVVVVPDRYPHSPFVSEAPMGTPPAE